MGLRRPWVSDDVGDCGAIYCLLLRLLDLALDLPEGLREDSWRACCCQEQQAMKGRCGLLCSGAHACIASAGVVTPRPLSVLLSCRDHTGKQYLVLFSVRFSVQPGYVSFQVFKIWAGRPPKFGQYFVRHAK